MKVMNRLVYVLCVTEIFVINLMQYIFGEQM